MRSKQMHKHNICLLLLVLGFPLFSMGNNKAEDFFLKGNKEYAKADYEGALKTYQQLLDDGYESAEVYFNIGNSNYKLGNMPSAILNYEKAHKLNPGDEDIELNLQLANLKITDKIEPVPEFFLATWWRSIVLFFSVSLWSILGIVTITLGFLLLIVYLFALALPIKKSAFYTGICLIFIGVLSIIMSEIQQAYFSRHQEAIVFAGTVNVKSGPDASQKTLFVIHEGTKVSIKNKNQNWIEVELPNGNTGWITLSDVKEI
ncbi:tetratricopeptide repeat protein [Pedobacter frigoris]|uniref:tetratricopeptide repeat protein n=1 Tax=Pedobacter frigoris TaxID=2571272 RepID=UPI002931D137|nr:tetratricopeptide repeat protein [Pedobacter frigoris]